METDPIDSNNEVIRLIIIDDDGQDVGEINQDDSSSADKNCNIKLEITNREDVDFELEESEYEANNDSALSEEDASILENIKIEVIDDPATEFGDTYYNYEKNEGDEDADASVESNKDSYRPRKKRKRHPLRTYNTDKPRKLHSCNICGYTSHQKSHYRRHLTVHFKPEGLRCSICRKPMLGKAELSDHMEEHRDPKERNKFKCNLCDYFSYKLTNVSQHTDIHYKPPEERLQCDQCEFSTTNKLKFAKHKSSHSNEKKDSKCPVCLTVFKNLTMRRRHIQRYRSPNDPTKFQCPECPYTNERFNNFKQHMVVHRTEYEIDMFHCSFCPFKSKRKTDLRQHVTVKHKKDDEVMMFKCDFCSYETRRGNHLTSHMRNRHKKQIIIKKCGQCSYRTVSSILIEKHFKIHAKMPQTFYLCSICGYGCTTEAILSKHMAEDHEDDDEDDMNFTWRVADKEPYQAKSDLVTDEPNYSFEFVKIKREIESEAEDNIVDDEIAVFCCQFPNCEFATESELDIKIHNTISHGKKGDDNKCPKCTFHTTSRFTFLDHLRVHLIDIEHLKPHLCDICGSRWIRQGDLTRHMSVHWSDEKKKKKQSGADAEASTKKLLKCPFCKYETRIRLCLYKHMAKHGRQQQMNFTEYLENSAESEEMEEEEML